MRQSSEIRKMPSSNGNDQGRNKDIDDKDVDTVFAESQALERASFGKIQHRIRKIDEVLLSPDRIDPHLVTLLDSNSEAVSQYQKLAVTLITTAIKNPPLKRVLITSAQHSEGRTCVMLNLASALAKSGQRVLVIDTDLLRPSVSRLLGLDTETGLSEMIREGFHPDLALKRLIPAGFDVLPTRAKVENTAELLASPDFAAMMMALDGNYDFMLFDSAPLLSSPDVNLLILHTHTTLMVVHPGKTSTSKMAKAISYLNEDSFLGVVLNRISH